MTTKIELKRPLVYGVWLIIASFLGLLAAFTLTLEKIHSLTNPGDGAACDFSIVVQCSTNLASSQGAIFGFPNPLIGLMVWPFVLVTGVLVLLNVKLPKLYWGTFLAGTTAGLIMVIWLMYQSIFILGTLCTWCMVTWTAMIPTFIATLFYSGTQGLFGTRLIKVFEKIKPYTLALDIVIFFSLAVIAQLRLDWLATIL